MKHAPLHYEYDVKNAKVTYHIIPIKSTLSLFNSPNPGLSSDLSNTSINQILNLARKSSLHGRQRVEVFEVSCRLTDLVDPYPGSDAIVNSSRLQILKGSEEDCETVEEVSEGLLVLGALVGDQDGGDAGSLREMVDDVGGVDGYGFER